MFEDKVFDDHDAHNQIKRGRKDKADKEGEKRQKDDLTAESCRIC